MRESALVEARAAEAGSAPGARPDRCNGIPFGPVKDCWRRRAFRDVGAEPVPEPGVTTTTHRGDELRAAGAVLVAKLAMVDWQGRMGYNLPTRRHRSRLSPLEHEVLERRLIERAGSRRVGRPVVFAIGSGDVGLDPHAVLVLRRHRAAATYGLVSRHARDGAVLVARQARTMCRSADDCRWCSRRSRPGPLDDSCTGKPFAWSGPRAQLKKKWRVAGPRAASRRCSPRFARTSKRRSSRSAASSR